MKNQYHRGRTNILVVARQDAEARLAKTCFRGVHSKLGGNFFKWESVSHLFSDWIIVKELLDEVEEQIAKREFGTNSVQIEYDEPVGWSSTEKLEHFKPEDLEDFEPNKRSVAKRVKTTRTDILAPQTSFVTIVYELKPEGREYVVLIRSVYPGEDIGELAGDITAEEGCVFFDWNHPGM